jgi:capsule polysaccharide export protein KpsE/RkpR
MFVKRGYTSLPSDYCLPCLQVTTRMEQLKTLEQREAAAMQLQAELAAKHAQLTQLKSVVDADSAAARKLADEAAAERASLEKSRMALIAEEADLRKQQLECQAAQQVRHLA